MWFRKRKHFGSIANRDIDPDEVLLDAFNLPSFNTSQFEGRVERSIHSRIPLFVGIIAVLIGVVFLLQVWKLQIVRGDEFATLSANNNLDQEVLFAERGLIFDRNGVELAWNVLPDIEEDIGDEYTKYSLRAYAPRDGLGHVLGFLGYPEKDAQGFWWRTEYTGKAGVESLFDDVLQGENGVRIIEVDALENVQSENTIQQPVDGHNVALSIDVNVQEALFNALKDGVHAAGFVGGSGVIMDVVTGEVIALTNYPEYSPQVMTDGVDEEVIAGYNTNNGRPFLNRAVLGEYTPGSIVKPYVAAAALEESMITPQTSILSTGEIRVPNPYVPGQDSIFRDWKPHGWVDVRSALAVSSNVFFYAIGGGYEHQKGLGIERLAAYAARFGLGVPTGIEFEGEASGVVPTPAWKRVIFGEQNPWRIGNTYHTSIGQFGFLVTPVQAVRYIAAVANGGNLVTPHIKKGDYTRVASVGIDDTQLAIVREGMRRAAEGGTAAAVNVPGIRIAGKTGTAQLGARNEWMNSWVVGFWPADEPRFAYAAVLERAPAGTLRGAAPALQSFFQWLVDTQPEYVRGEYPEALSENEQ